jgi:hypothetical protein
MSAPRSGWHERGGARGCRRGRAGGRWRGGGERRGMVNLDGGVGGRQRGGAEPWEARPS